MKPRYGYLWAFITIAALLTACDQHEAPTETGQQRLHPVEVTHPGSDTPEPVKGTLIQTLDEHNQASEYKMDVDSVFCGEKICKIDTVTLVWGPLGEYRGIELKPGVELEKGDAEPFNEEDYSKLDLVLAKPDSGLAELHKSELVTPESGGNAVDALSGATVAIRNNDYIKGAIWTCYTLWHWVNGGTVSIIRDLTGDRLTDEQLLGYLHGGEARFSAFAFQQLVKRNISDQMIYPQLVDYALRQGVENQRLLVRAIETLSVENYYPALSELINYEEPGLHLIILNALLNTTKTPPQGFFANMSAHVKGWNNYQNTDLFLKVLKKRNRFSETVINELIELLNHSNFVVARNAYWQMIDLKLSADNKEKMDRFYQLNSKRL